MADYWKSQDRKYCDFCKCWIADNKPSVEFHEKGKRHQENVKKRVKTITRNSLKAQKETERFEVSLKQIESAALAAYKKDVAANSSADLTSINIHKQLNEGNKTKVWHEAKSKEGHTYYWNIMTNESIWEPPKEGFLSLKEQKEQADVKTAQELKLVEQQKRLEAIQMMQVQKSQEEEERARLAREKMKERRVEVEPEPVYGPILEPGKTNPYGRWETVKESKMVDLQLPHQEYVEYPVIEPEPEPVLKEFKEKTVESLEKKLSEELSEEGEGISTFRKRKIISGAKKNTRRRLDDD